jgi:DNA-directed RNA polymerase beta' subunit
MKKQSFIIILSLLLLGNYAVYADENANLETNKTEEVSNNEDSTEIEEELSETTEKVKTKEQAPEDLESEKESLSKKTTIKKNKEKKTNKNKIPKATIKKVENLIFQDNQLEIYKMKTGMSRDWLSPYYSLQKVLLVNLTDSELKVNGDILNKVLKQEARSKVAQIVEEKKARSRAASSAGMVNGGLVGAAFSAGSLATDISTDRGERELLGQINKLIDDKPF